MLLKMNLGIVAFYLEVGNNPLGLLIEFDGTCGEYQGRQISITPMVLPSNLPCMFFHSCFTK